MKVNELIRMSNDVVCYRNVANFLIVRCRDPIIPPHIELLLQLTAYKHGLEIAKYSYGDSFDQVNKSGPRWGVINEEDSFINEEDS